MREPTAAAAPAPNPNDVTAERELLLLALRPSTAGIAARIRSLVGAGPNWDELLWDTHWHGTTSLLGQALHAHTRELVPAIVADRLRRHARTAATYALHQLKLLRDMAPCLKAIDIPFAAGIGPVFAQAYYGDAGMRDPAGLSELWVLPGDLESATDALRSAGFTVHPGDGIHRSEVRLRTCVSKQSGIEIDRPALERSRSVVAGLRIMATADLLVILAAPLAARAWGRAERLADFVAALQHTTASEIEQAVRLARAAGLETALGIALALAADLPGGPSLPALEIDPDRLEASRRLLRGRERITLAEPQLDHDTPRPEPLLPTATAASRTGALAQFVPNEPGIVDAMLDLAETRSSDVLFDLGCGDGRVLIRAAQRYGLRAIGVEWDPALVEEGRRRVREAGVSALVEVRQGDVHTADISHATVVYTYLGNAQAALAPRLRRDLNAGTRLVSRDFDYGPWPPERTEVLPLLYRSPPVWLFRWSIGS